jgi:hypothetical protein
VHASSYQHCTFCKCRLTVSAMSVTVLSLSMLGHACSRSKVCLETFLSISGTRHHSRSCRQ